MLQLEVFILKRLAVNRLATCAVSLREIPSLQSSTVSSKHKPFYQFCWCSRDQWYGKANLTHEVWYHAVKFAALVVQLFARLSQSALARAECPEIFTSPRARVCKQAYHDPASRLVTDLYFEKDTGQVHCSQAAIKQLAVLARRSDTAT